MALTLGIAMPAGAVEVSDLKNQLQALQEQMDQLKQQLDTVTIKVQHLQTVT